MYKDLFSSFILFCFSNISQKKLIKILGIMLNSFAQFFTNSFFFPVSFDYINIVLMGFTSSFIFSITFKGLFSLSNNKFLFPSQSIQKASNAFQLHLFLFFSFVVMHIHFFYLSFISFLLTSNLMA